MCTDDNDQVCAVQSNSNTAISAMNREKKRNAYRQGFPFVGCVQNEVRMGVDYEALLTATLQLNNVCQVMNTCRSYSSSYRRSKGVKKKKKIPVSGGNLWV